MYEINSWTGKVFPGCTILTLCKDRSLLDTLPVASCVCVKNVFRRFCFRIINRSYENRTFLECHTTLILFKFS